ncbi:MAG TPA: nucleotidyltransferase [Chthonomonadales bacterium]|nr:nucleotidyltransferase [Chthonomonadales bacterium]
MDVELPDDFKEFLASLNSSEVEYLLIGGYAVGFHGYPRATNDIDLWVRVSADNAARIAYALRQFGFATATSTLFTVPQSVIRMGRPPLRIEIITGISGVDFDECYAGREDAKLDGIPVPVISRAHLVANKQAAGRAKDVADVEALTRKTRQRPRSS